MSVYSRLIKVSPDSMNVTITHNLNNVNAKLVGFTPWNWFTTIAIQSKSTNNMVIAFNSKSPSQTSGVDVKVVTV